MKQALASLLTVAMATTLTAPEAAGQGRVFLTGHDPDFHAQSSVGAQNLLNAGLSFVTDGTYNLNDGNKFLWVESRIAPPSGHLIGENGLIAIGLTLGTHYERANAAELPAVDFGDFTAIAVASSFGGLLTRDELDGLIARSEDIKDYINGGGGLIALSECFPCGANLLAGVTPPELYAYLPVEVSSIPPSPPFTITAFGAAPPFNLTNGDINDPTHNSFGLIGGLEPIDIDQASQATTLAGSVFVGGNILTQISLLPEDATNPLGTSHDLTAKVFDLLSGEGIADVDVTFDVISGPNAGDSGQDVTDVNGDAFFAYVGDGGPGTDVIEASFVDLRGVVQTSNQATKTWEEEPECYLFMGTGTEFITSPWDVRDVLLVDVLFTMPVTIETMPLFAVPNEAILAGVDLYWQVFMNNAEVFPDDPVQLTNGVKTTLGSASLPDQYGPDSTMELIPLQPAHLGGVIDMTFTIDGL